MQVKKRNATMGHSRAFRFSVEYRQDGAVTIRLFGEESYYLEVGKKKGTAPPVIAIYQWIKNKGIPYKNDKQRKSMAIAICRSIYKKGTILSRGPNEIIYSDFFNKPTISVVQALILADFKKQIKAKADELTKKM